MITPSTMLPLGTPVRSSRRAEAFHRLQRQVEAGLWRLTLEESRYNVTVLQVRFCRNRAGQRVAYSDEGEGPLVLLPAWGVSHLERNADDPAYRRFFARLTERLRVVRYDRVGVGLSDRTRTTFTLQSEVDDLAALVEH